MQPIRHIIAIFCLTLALPVAAQDLRDQGNAATGWLNDFRVAKGRAPVSVSPKLTAAAAAHARDMASRGFFSHTGSDGSGIGDRIRAQGYRFCFVAENIAKGQRSLEQVLEAWARSDGHRRNMLAKDASEFGLIQGAGTVWVMVLGHPGC
ncbi:MAG: CAP domain-containing protein [Pseudomonadota bacterium]